VKAAKAVCIDILRSFGSLSNSADNQNLMRFLSEFSRAAFNDSIMFKSPHPDTMQFPIC
jgi:hypothetical protein